MKMTEFLISWYKDLAWELVVDIGGVKGGRVIVAVPLLLIALAEIGDINDDGWISTLESKKMVIIIVATAARHNTDSDIDDGNSILLLSNEKFIFIY